MKKLTLALLASVAAMFVGCTTNLGVESETHPEANYDSASGEMIGRFDGDINVVFKAANTALDQLKYYRVGQKVKPNTAKIIARGPKDAFISVAISQEKPGICKAVFKYGSGNLMKCQEIYNQMSKVLKGM